MSTGATVTPWQHACRFLPFYDSSQDEIERRLLAMDCHLWVGPDSAVVTEVTDDNMLHIMEAGGTLRGLLAMLKDAEAFARAIGCKGLQLAGRRGWQRVLPEYGFVRHGDWMMKTL